MLKQKWLTVRLIPQLIAKYSLTARQFRFFFGDDLENNGVHLVNPANSLPQLGGYLGNTATAC